jgi:hypothetical protein
MSDNKILSNVKKIPCMCWSKPASMAAALCGVALLIFKIKFQGASWIALLPVALYTLMELLQWKQYDTLDRCDKTENTLLARLAYVIIWLQPIVWNFMWMKQDGHPIFRYTFAISIVVFLLCLDRNWLHLIHKGDVNRKEAHNHGKDCSRAGKSHLFWSFDLKTNSGLEPNWLLYFVLMFGSQMYLGDKNHFVKMMAVGLVLAWTLAKGRVEEMSAYWCANSIPYFLFAEFAASALGRK